jgi:hypothetical protein
VNSRVPDLRKPSAISVSTIEGQRDAARLLYVVRTGCSPADALLEALQRVTATDDAARLRGFTRGLQKALEGRA